MGSLLISILVIVGIVALFSIIVLVGVVALFRALERNFYHTPQDRQNTYTRDDYAVQEEALRSQADTRS